MDASREEFEHLEGCYQRLSELGEKEKQTLSGLVRWISDNWELFWFERRYK